MVMNSKRFYVFSAGCIRRGLDTIHMQQYLQANGWTHTRWISRADLIIVATCGVVRLNEVSSLNGIAAAVQAKRQSATIAVTGCLPIINPDAISALGDFVIIPTKQESKLDELIHATIPYASVSAPDSITDNQDIVNYLVARSFCRRFAPYKWFFYKFGMNPYFLSISVAVNRAWNRLAGLIAGKPARKLVPYFNIKIADGCLSDCTYCATKFATGKLHSRSADAILDNFRSGLEKGYRVFQLIAEDTGCWGLDIGDTLASLLTRIFAIEGDYQLIIIDCCPQWLVGEYRGIIDVLVANQERIKEVFIPLQSGCDQVLQRMKRGYTAAEVKEMLSALNERAPDIALRTSLLIGFPGETDTNFQETIQFLSGLKFAEIAINRYEDRPGTESSAMPDKVPQQTIEDRAHYLAEKLNCKILS